METGTETAEKYFVEEVGIFIEELGWPRMAGRILGRLLIAEPAHQSAEELSEALIASKGSISNVTRLLIQYGLIERLSLPGVRRDYFRVKPGGWDHLLGQKLSLLSSFRGIIKKGLELLKEKDSFTRQWLEEMYDFYAFLEREFPLLIANWEQERARSRARAK